MGRGRRVRMSSSGDRRKLSKSRAPTTAQEHVTDRYPTHPVRRARMPSKGLRGALEERRRRGFVR
jgi:hypothetical protein